MKLEVGRYYRTRDGRKIGPMGVNTRGLWDKSHPFKSDGHTYMADGRWDADGDESSHDLIAEWLEEAPDGHQESDYHEWNLALEAVVKQLYHLGNSKLLDGNSAFMVLSIIHEMKR